MAKIKISNLQAAGYDLFQDSESFLNELAQEQEIKAAVGGAMVSIISIKSYPCLTLCPPTLPTSPITFPSSVGVG